MNLPCKTCLVLPICKQLICPNPPRFVSSTKIVKYLLTNKTVKSINCNMLKEYCGIYGNLNAERPISNIYDVTQFFCQPYEEGDYNNGLVSM